MRRRWVAGFVLAVLFLGSSATFADPTNWGQLAQIILWLQQIDQTLRDLNVVVDDIRGNLAQVYPEACRDQEGPSCFFGARPAGRPCPR